MKKSFKLIALGGVASVLLLGSSWTAQAQGQGGRGGFDPAQMQQRMMESYQETLGMSADEFKAVQPLIEGVMTKQRETMGMGRGFGGGGFGRARGGPGGGGGGGQGGDPGQGNRGRGFGGEPSPEQTALQQAVESGTPSEIKAKLEAYREARKKKEADLQDAREKLRKVLTQKQEAALVLRGLLN